LIDDIPLLESYHIIPYHDGGSFAVSNGIALNYQMHKMFDKGLFSFMSDGKNIRIITSQSKKISDSDCILQRLSNKPIQLSKNIKDHPNLSAINYHLEKFLLR